MPYIIAMIRSFRSKALRDFYETGSAKRLSVQNTARIGRILRALDAAREPQAMNLPGYRFHGLTGKDRGRYSVWATANWRVTFGWADEDAVDVDLEDYH